MRRVETLGALGAAAVAVICCAALPVIAGLVGALTLGVVLGGAVGLLVFGGLLAAGFARWRRAMTTGRR
jgi:hypothetical protein